MLELMGGIFKFIETDKLKETGERRNRTMQV